MIAIIATKRIKNESPTNIHRAMVAMRTVALELDMWVCAQCAALSGDAKRYVVHCALRVRICLFVRRNFLSRCVGDTVTLFFDILSIYSVNG